MTTIFQAIFKKEIFFQTNNYIRRLFTYSWDWNIKIRKFLYFLCQCIFYSVHGNCYWVVAKVIADFFMQIKHFFFKYKEWFLINDIFSIWFNGLYRQKTEPNAISQLHHYWKFYRTRSSVKIEINSNLMVQGQGYIVDVTSLTNQALIIFGKRLKMCVV